MLQPRLSRTSSAVLCSTGTGGFISPTGAASTATNLAASFLDTADEDMSAAAPASRSFFFQPKNSPLRNPRRCATHPHDKIPTRSDRSVPAPQLTPATLPMPQSCVVPCFNNAALSRSEQDALQIALRIVLRFRSDQVRAIISDRRSPVLPISRTIARSRTESCFTSFWNSSGMRTSLSRRRFCDVLTLLIGLNVSHS